MYNFSNFYVMGIIIFRLMCEFNDSEKQVYEFLADFTDDTPTQTVQEESSALAYKK